MGAAQITINASFQDLFSAQDLEEGDVRELVALLQGESVVDWTQLYFRNIPAVDEFLRVSGYDPDKPSDMARLADIHREAVRYIRMSLEIEVPEVLAHPHRIQNLFLYASSRNRYRSHSCMILKVMLVVHHLEARELLFHLPCSEQALFRRVDDIVSDAVSLMFAQGVGIDEFQPSRKTKDSLVTKLLSKRKSTAAQVFDRIRFRIITRDRASIMPTLLLLKKRLVPFAFVIPGESTNTLESLGALLQDGLKLADVDFPEPSHRPAFNRFSHQDFRVISFVVDIPVKVTDLIEASQSPILSRFGDVVMIPTEFQVFDRVTYDENERGPASHLLYKERQVMEVIRRLYSGRTPEE